ncbi:MAG: guanylate kinase [Chloroflexota bacterium]|nr:guanylate kinase [Chloroflexota bacterium]
MVIEEKQSPGGDAEGNSELVAQLGEMLAAEGPVHEIEEYVQRPAPALLVILTGPSGVGKDVTLGRMHEMGLPFHYVVTVTTRKIRPGEVDGQSYFFKTREEYNDMLANDELLEHAEVYGNGYGVPRNQVAEPLRRGLDVIMKPDVQGAGTLRKLEPNAVYIFLAPPSMEELLERLYMRKTEDHGELARRLRVARQEMQAISDFDYVVVNRKGELDKTVEDICAIIKAEKARVHPRKLDLVSIK